MGFWRAACEREPLLVLLFNILLVHLSSSNLRTAPFNYVIMSKQYVFIMINVDISLKQWGSLFCFCFVWPEYTVPAEFWFIWMFRCIFLALEMIAVLIIANCSLYWKCCSCWFQVILQLFSNLCWLKLNNKNKRICLSPLQNLNRILNSYADLNKKYNNQ